MIKIEQIISEERLDPAVKQQVILYKGEAYTFYDAGLTRYVFVNGDKSKVIKILIDERHKDYNQEEFDLYNSASKEKKQEIAKTAMDGRIIEQEFCLPIKFSDRKLTIKQILFATSCRNEVGWTADGRLVCFDLDEYKRY